MKDPFKRGFPQDLPLRPSTSAHFDWQAQSRNLFDLRLPESLQALNTGILTMPIREYNALNWSWQETQAVVCMRLISAPDFCDTSRARTSWWDGEWHALERGFPHVALKRFLSSL